MEYTIWFTIFGKKLKTVIEANSEEEAEYKLRGKIKIDKIESRNEVVDFLSEFLKRKG